MYGPRRSSSSSPKPLRRLAPMTSLRSLLQSVLSPPERYPLMWDCLDLDIAPTQSLLSLPQSALARNQCSLPAISALAPRNQCSPGRQNVLPKLSFYQLFGLFQKALSTLSRKRARQKPLFFSIFLYFCLPLSTLELLAGQFAIFILQFSICNPPLNSHPPSTHTLEPRRPFPRNCELAFEGQACLPYQSVVEQPAEDRDAVRHAPGRIELGQRIRRIRGPVASRFRDLDEPRAECERRMAGEVRDRELLVAQRWHDHQVDLPEDAGHFERHFAPQPVGLDEIDRRKKSRLAEQVGPRVLDLYLERSELVVER